MYKKEYAANLPLNTSKQQLVIIRRKTNLTMQQLTQNFRFNPLNFLVSKIKDSKSYPHSYKSLRTKVSHFPDAFIKTHKQKARVTLNKKRHQVLPYKGGDVISQVYFQNRLKLRYIEYFQDQLNYLSGVLKRCMAITTWMGIGQRVQLISKQITFLRLESNKILAEIISNHFQLKESVVRSSEVRLDLVEKEEAKISFDITVFLSNLANTKKDIIQLFKKVQQCKHQLNVDAMAS